MIPDAEAALALLQDIEAGTFLQMLDQRLGIGALGLGVALRDDLHRHVVAPGLVVRRPLELVGEALGEGLRGRDLDAVIPQALPVTGQVF